MIEQRILSQNVTIKLPKDKEPLRQRQYEVLSEVVEHAWLNDLGNFYEYRGKAQVSAYLLTHPDLIDFLKDSYFQLRKCFGLDASYVLEVVTDPESNHPTLFGYIRTGLPIDEAQAKLDEFDDEWFLDRIEQVGNYLNFNLEMVGLEKSAEAGNEQAFIEAAQAISWQTRPPGDFLRAIHFAFAAGAHLYARRLAAKGAEQYPEHQELQKYARILAPPKVIQSNLPPDPTLGANRDWLKKHRHNYSEQWLALKNGELLGTAITLQKLMGRVGKREGILFTKGG